MRAHGRRVARPAVRLGRRGGGQVECDPPGARRGRDRDRRRPDVAGGRLVPGDPQGAPAGSRSPGRRVSFRRVLSVPRRGRRGRPRGRGRDHPAGRIGEGRRSRGGGRSGGSGDGIHRHPTVQALTRDRGMTDPQNPDVAAERPPYLLAGLVGLGALVLYVLTLAPTTQFWDASEYITGAHALGIPHPPGSPLFVILAHAWGLIPLGVDYAQRINLFAAVTSAAAAAMWFLIGERWLRPIVATAGRRRLVAVAGAVVGATAFTVWNQSVVNEKVYTLSVLTIALVLWLTMRWADQPAEPRRDHLLLVVVYLIALSATNHLM